MNESKGKASLFEQLPEHKKRLSACMLYEDIRKLQVEEQKQRGAQTSEEANQADSQTR